LVVVVMVVVVVVVVVVMVVVVVVAPVAARVMMVGRAMVVIMMIVVTVGVIDGAIRRAGVRHRLVHDLLDGPRAAPALPAAAETAINLTGGKRVLGRRNRRANIVVRQDIA
jgi:hypothetical protein